MSNKELEDSSNSQENLSGNDSNENPSMNDNPLNYEDLKNMIKNLTPEDLKASYKNSVMEVKRKILSYRSMEKQIMGQKQLTGKSRNQDLKKIKKMVARLSTNLSYLEKPATKALLMESAGNKDLMLEYIDNLMKVQEDLKVLENENNNGNKNIDSVEPTQE